MTSIFDNHQLEQMIEVALTASRYHTCSDELTELYLLFGSKGFFISEDLDALEDADQIIPNINRRAISASDAHRDLTVYLDQLKEYIESSSSVHLSNPKSSFRFKRSSWVALVIDEYVTSKAFSTSPLGKLYTIVRLIKITPLALDHETEQRILKLVQTDDDILIWVEDSIGLMTITNWLTQLPHIVESSFTHANTSLPKGWRWLCTDKSDSNEEKSHWSNPTIEIKRIVNIEERLAHHPPLKESEDRFKWLLTLQKSGLFGYMMQVNSRWQPLDQLSALEWAEKTHLPLNVASSKARISDLNMINEVSRKPVDEVLEGPQRGLREDVVAIVVDYEEVLSGLSSESSTIQVSSHSFMDPPHTDLNVPYEKTEDTFEDHTKLLFANISEPLDDEDQSAILDISLSEIPMQRLSDLQDEKAGEFEDPAFRVVKDILSTGSNLEINRRISTSDSSSDSHSLVTHQTQEFESSPDDSFVYNTINRRQNVPHEPLEDFPTYNERIQVIEDLESKADLESLPTRIDLNTEQVLGALERERSDTITRIVSDDEKSVSFSDPLPKELTEVAPTFIEDRPIKSQIENDLHHERAEALSRENTAKLRVRDFEMLTDIKDRHEIPPPSSMQRSFNEASQASRPGQGRPPVITPPPPLLSPSSGPGRTLPLHSPTPPQAPSTPPNAMHNAKFVHQEPTKAAPKTHKDRRSFSDVIRSLTSKNNS